MRKRILIVEDDDRHRALLQAVLARQEYYVEAATDGLEAVQRARLGWFDMVLLHAGVPEVDGLAAARLIHDLTRDHGSPLIVALAADPADLPPGAGGAWPGFAAVLPRPCEPSAVLQTMRLAFAEPAAFPHPAPAPPWPAPRRHEPGRHRRPRILLVDDDDLPRELLSALLHEQGFEVEPAADGLQAVLMMADGGYDAAILDYDMPRMNGMAAARLAHDLLSPAHRPRLIALTANPERVRHQRCGCAPLFDEIIPKSAGFAPVLTCLVRPRAAALPAGRIQDSRVA